jgi:hypothetical protein
VRHTVFGGQEVRTRVYHVLPEEAPALDIIGLLTATRPGEGAPGAAREEAWVL